MGGELNEILLILNTREALASLMGSTQVTHVHVHVNVHVHVHVHVHVGHTAHSVTT